MRFSPHLVLVCGIFSLAGCATNDSLIDRGLQATVAQPLVQDSIMREGDRLSFQVLLP